MSQLLTTLAEVWWIIPIFLSVGVVFSTIEAIIPGFGFFGISGIVFFVAGTTCYGFIADEAWKVLLMVVCVAVFIVFMFVMIGRSAKKGFLGKTPFVENKTALPVDYDLESMMVNSQFIDKYGKTICDCRPVGKISINGKVLEVYAKNDMIPKNVIVKIVGVDDDKIYVEEVKQGVNE